MTHRFFLPILVAKRPPISVAMMLPSTGTVTKHCSSIAEAFGKSCLRLDTTAAVTEMLCSSKASERIAPFSITFFRPDCGSCDSGSALSTCVAAMVASLIFAPSLSSSPTALLRSPSLLTTCRRKWFKHMSAQNDLLRHFLTLEGCFVTCLCDMPTDVIHGDVRAGTPPALRRTAP